MCFLKRRKAMIDAVIDWIGKLFDRVKNLPFKASVQQSFWIEQRSLIRLDKTDGLCSPVSSCFV